VNRPPGNFPGDHAESDNPREGESADAADPVDASAGEPLPRRPSDPHEAWEERTEEALPISEQAGPVDASTDEGEGISDEVTPPIAVAPRALDAGEYEEAPPALMQKFREHEIEATQEISPEELEIQPLPARAASEPRGVPVPPTGQLTQLALSDLFDSAPAPGSVTLAPPNVAEFASSRPPPAPGAARPSEPIRRPTPAGAGIMALPSIPVNAERPAEPSHASAPTAATALKSSLQPGAVARLPSQPGVTDSHTPSQPFAASPGRERMPSSPGRERMPSSPGRERMPSSPGRERMPSSPGREVAASREPLRDSTPPPPRDATPTPPRAVEKTPSPTPPPVSELDDSEPVTPPKPAVAARAPVEPEPREAASPAPEQAAALTPTPAVHGIPAAGPRPNSRPAPGARRPLTPPAEPQSLIAAPAATRQPSAGTSLPSVVLSPSIETDTEQQPNLRAMRSTRATVRLSSVEALDILRQARASSSPPVSSAPQISTRSLSPASMRALMLRTKPWAWIAAGGLVLVLLLVWILWPSTGALMVTVSGPGGAPVEGVKVLVDGKPVCESSPCRVPDLEAGVHRVRASAVGMADIAEEAVSISSGGEAVHNIRLGPTVSETGGLQISAGNEPLTLVLDGKVIGPLPQKLFGLAPGEHWIKLESHAGEQPIEKSVVIGAGEILQVEPARLKGNKTLVTIELSRESEGATVTLNDDFLLDFPAELELPPGESQLHASKPGFKDYKAQVKIAPGEASKHLIIDLEPQGSSRPRQRVPSRAATGATAKPKPTATAAATSTAPGILNISSTPASSVILNGRPLGMTPRTGIEVPGNSMQTVIFVHPTMGRRRAQQIVPAGQTKTISIRF
jgi:hypothetical protein